MADEGRVELREVTEKTLRDVLALEVAESQRRFVADNARSIAQAHFSEHAWFRAIYADGNPVGFLMLHDEPARSQYVLWRLMVDRRHQGKGYGRRALEILIEHVRGRPGATELLTSVVPHDDGPQPFYEKLGFEATGEFEDGEAVLRLGLI